MADTTARGYPYPEGDDVWRASAEDDGAAPWKNLAEAVDADVAAVEAAASGATSGVAGDLADHENATTSVHGIADTSVLVTTARQITAGTGLTGGGTLAADRTISIAAGGVGTTELANDAVTSAKIADGAIATADLANGAVTDAKLAGSITPSKVTGTAVVQARSITAGTGLTGGGDLSADRTISIAAGGVGTTELANDAVTTGKIAAGAVGTTDIADSAVTSAKIADGTIVNADLSGSAAIDPAKVAGTAVVESTATTKGDVLVRGASELVRLPVGVAGTNPLLIPDTSASGGLKWGTWAEADVARASQVGNLLTANQASLETNTTGWSGSNITLTRDTGQYVSGGASLKLTSSTSSVAGKSAYTTSQVTGVVAEQIYTVQAQIKTDGVAQARVGIQFWSSSDGIGPIVYGNYVTATSWTTSMLTATAPAGADRAFVYIFFNSEAPSGSYVYADCLGLWQGSGGTWALPGTPISGLIDGYVTEPKIAPGAVTAAKLAEDAKPANNRLSLTQSNFSATPSPVLTYFNASGAVVAGAGSDGVGNALRVTSTGGSAAFYVTAKGLTAGVAYTATIRVKASTAAFVRIQFQTSGGTNLTAHNATHTGGGGWETLTVTAVAPATAGQFILYIYTAATSGTIDCEQFGWWVGPGGTWVPGGSPVPGIGTRVTADGTVQVWDGDSWAAAASLAPITPRILLPADISAVVGDTLQLFRRGIVEAQDPYAAASKMECAKGSEFPRFFEWTPAAGDSGTSQTLTVTAQGSDQTALATASTSLVVKTAANPASMKRVMCVGDSLTSPLVWPTEAYRRLTQSGGTPAGHGFTNFDFIGNLPLTGYPTQGAFGVGGWTWASWTGAAAVVSYILTAAGHGKDATDQKSRWTAAGSTWFIEDIIDPDTIRVIRSSGTGTLGSSGTLTWSSGGTHTAAINWTAATATAGTPFWDGSAFSIKAWCDAFNGGDGPDLVVALLGWNNITASAVASGYTTVINQAKVFADKLRAEYPDAKMCVLGLQMPSPDGGLGTNYGATGVYSHYYDLVRYTNGLNLAYQAWAAEAGYSSWLRYASLAAQFDSENNMPAGTAAVNSRNATTERRGTNGIHPATAGYLQIADVAYREIVRAFA